MSLPKCYRDEMLNRRPADRIAPVLSLQKVLKGISAGRIFVPRPVVGLEHEYNIAAVLGARGYRKPDDICIDYLLAAAVKRGALSAYGRYAGGYHESVFDRGQKNARLAASSRKAEQMDQRVLAFGGVKRARGS